MRRSYSELARIESYDERFEYLALRGRVGNITFGHERALNQEFYHSALWKRARRTVIIRDDNCDLGIPGYDIHSHAHIHHIIPMTVDDLRNHNPLVLDPENLITVTQATHNAIHYGDKRQLPRSFVERRPGDTWI